MGQNNPSFHFPELPSNSHSASNEDSFFETGVDLPSNQPHSSVHKHYFWGYLPKTCNQSTRKVCRVLVVADSPAERRLLVRSLKKIKKIEALGTGDGFRADKLLSTFQPHLLLLDLFSKDCHGHDFVKKIRLDAEWKILPIAAIAGSHYHIEHQDILRRGFNGMISKPISLDTLEEFLRPFLC